MSYQTGIITRNKKLFPNQTAELNARLPFLNDILSQQSEREYQGAQIKNMEIQTALDKSRFELEQERFKLSEKELGLKESEVAAREKERIWSQQNAQKQYDLQKRGEAMQMGIKGAGLGATLLGSSGSLSLGGIKDKIFGKSDTPQQLGMEGQQSENTSSFWSDLPIGASIGGGLVGFGASRLGGKNKLLSSAIGAGAGSLAGWLGSGSMGGAIGGGLLGGLGGLF